MTTFSDATRVTLHDQGGYAGEVPEGWDIMGATNGGYLLAVVARAITAEAQRPDPISITGHFLSPVTPGAVRLEADVVRTGRRFATVTASMTAGDRLAISALATVGDLSTQQEAVTHIAAGPPDLPEPQDCVKVEPTETFPPPFMGKVEVRLPPDTVFGAGDRAHVSGWFRLLDDEPLDTVAVVCASDAFPPAIFFSGLPIAWVPTVELTVQIRRRPVGQWLACQFDTTFVSDGFLEEDGQMWDEAGTLIALSRQVALVPRR